MTRQQQRRSEPRRAEDRQRHTEDRHRLLLALACVLLSAVIAAGAYLWIWSTARQAGHTAAQSITQGEGLQAQATTAKKLAAKVAEIQAREATNRAFNVTVWCDAINQDRDYNRAFVARYHLRYGLRDLPCAALAAATRQSQSSTPPSPPGAPAARPLAGLAHPCTAGDFYMQCAAPASNVLKLAPPVGVSVLARGVDFAWGAPSVGQMRAWGASFGASYYSYDLSKNWTAAAVRAYHRAGIATVGVWETAADRALADYAAGRSDASAAARQAASVGEPASRPIYFAVDFDTTFYGCRICAYFRGVRSVLGSRTGAYGGIATIRTLFGQGLIGYGWQTSAWSSGQWDPRAHLQQYAYTNTVDFDRATARDYGQWPYAAPAPARHPSRAQLRARWRRERARTLVAYHRAGCTAHSQSRTCVRLRAREHALYLDLRRR